MESEFILLLKYNRFLSRSSKSLMSWLCDSCDNIGSVPLSESQIAEYWKHNVKLFPSSKEELLTKVLRGLSNISINVL